ncbi:MAG: hypothetical protein GX823_03760, partial [Clostridiales bacterium]|nr:hypothetical protein [Clostridiales bacterium]
MKSIFDAVDLNGKAFAKNRICRSATDEGVCENGRLGEVFFRIYSQLAKGGAGLITSGMAEVSKSGLFVPGVALAYRDDYEKQLGPVCDTMRENGAVFTVQLTHSGM